MHREQKEVVHTNAREPLTTTTGIVVDALYACMGSLRNIVADWRYSEYAGFFGGLFAISHIRDHAMQATIHAAIVDHLTASNIQTQSDLECVTIAIEDSSDGHDISVRIIPAYGDLLIVNNQST